jgi:hypothetical protein
MPNPINRIVPDPHVVLDTNALSDKPEMAIAVARIISIWGSIERELSSVLVRLLGANASSAHAIFSILQTQALQTKALEAAAKSVLDKDGFDAFNAVMAVVDSVKKTRNRLAHWCWGTCQQRPEYLILADPKMLKARDERAAAYFQSLKPGTFSPEETWDAIQFDDSAMLAYSIEDFKRSIRDLIQAEYILLVYSMVLDPSVGLAHAKALGLPDSADEIRRHLLEKLMTQRLFSEALDRIRDSRPK